jgi:hypothetical protein
MAGVANSTVHVWVNGFKSADYPASPGMVNPLARSKLSFSSNNQGGHGRISIILSHCASSPEILSCALRVR